MTTASVLVGIWIDNTSALHALGRVSLLDMTMAKLQEVRGIHRVLCLVAAKLKKRVTAALAGTGAEVVAVPDTVCDSDTLQDWLCAASSPAADARVLVLCRPTVPFLLPAKIQACIDLVSRGHADCAFTAREAHAYTAQGRTKAQVEMPGCRVVVPAKVRAGNKNIKNKPVPVNCLEALDVTEPAHHRLAVVMLMTEPFAL